MMRLTTLLLLFVSLSVAAQQPAPAQRAAPTLADLERDVAASVDVGEMLQLAHHMTGAANAKPRAIILKRLVELRPHLGSLRYELAAAYAEQDLKSETYSTLLGLQSQGYAMLPSDDPRFAAVRETQVWDHIIKAMELNAEPFGEAEIAWRLPAEDLLIESLAWDPKRAQLLVGGAREGAVYRVGKDGSLSTLVKADAENGLWAVFDIAVDSTRGALWVASTAVPHFKGYDPEKHLGRAGIFEFDLQTGKLRNRYLSPAILGASFFMSSLAIGPKGEVYAADGVNNAVYTIKDGELKRLFHAPGLSSIRGIAISGDGKLLYSADHQAGIIGFDLLSGQPIELRAPKSLALGGLEGIVWWEGHLIIVQSGMSPKRVMRLTLAPDGRSITAVQPLLASHPEMDLPTMLTPAGDSVYLIGNSQKSNYDRFGLLRDASRLEGTAVFKIAPGASPAPPQDALPAGEPQQ